MAVSTSGAGASSSVGCVGPLPSCVPPPSSWSWVPSLCVLPLSSLGVSCPPPPSLGGSCPPLWSGASGPPPPRPGRLVPRSGRTPPARRLTVPPHRRRSCCRCRRLRIGGADRNSGEQRRQRHRDGSGETGGFARPGRTERSGRAVHQDLPRGCHGHHGIAIKPSGAPTWNPLAVCWRVADWYGAVPRSVSTGLQTCAAFGSFTDRARADEPPDPVAPPPVRFGATHRHRAGRRCRTRARRGRGAAAHHVCGPGCRRPYLARRPAELSAARAARRGHPRRRDRRGRRIAV